jgi:archaemetzincin
LLGVLLAVATGAAVAVWWPEPRPMADRWLVVTSFGAVPARDLAFVARDLRAFFGTPSRREPAQSPPPGAWHAQRRQHDGGRLVDALNARPWLVGERVIALCDADGMRPDLNFVLGIAALRGRCAVVFLPRLREHADRARYERRLSVTARHEIGHVYGLNHCPDVRCAMAFSNSVAESDTKGLGFCERCTRRLRRLRL